MPGKVACSFLRRKDVGTYIKKWKDFNHTVTNGSRLSRAFLPSDSNLLFPSTVTEIETWNSCWNFSDYLFRPRMVHGLKIPYQTLHRRFEKTDSVSRNGDKCADQFLSENRIFSFDRNLIAYLVSYYVCTTFKSRERWGRKGAILVFVLELQIGVYGIFSHRCHYLLIYLEPVMKNFTMFWSEKIVLNIQTFRREPLRIITLVYQYVDWLRSSTF